MRRHAELRTVNPESSSGKVTVSKSVGSESHDAGSATTGRGAGGLSVLSPIREMERFFEESIHRPFFGMNMSPFRNMFQDFGFGGEVTPSCDMFEEGGTLVVKAEIPGLSRDEINVKIVDNNLMISGEKRTEEKVERKDYLRLERSHGLFNRTLSLPEGLDSNHVKAYYKDGVLEVRIPRIEGKSAIHQVKVE